MPDLTKVNRSQITTYLDTSSGSASPTWKLLGVGVTEYAIAYNPQVTTEKWIIHDNANSSLDSNQKQGDVSQSIYKGDECFEYINSLRDKVGGQVQTKVLDIDIWNSKDDGASYPAKMSDVIIAVTSYGGETATIEYSIYYNGDPIEGKVSISDGTPTFTPTVSEE